MKYELRGVGSGYVIKGALDDSPLMPPQPETTEPTGPSVPSGDTAVVEAPPMPSASEGTHPMAASPEEGMLAVPQERVMSQLQKLLRLKYAGIIMYANYGDRIRAHFRDSIYNHFQEHLKEEREGAYDLAMKLTAWGGEPSPKMAPVADVNDLHQIFMCVIVAEKQLIECERQLLTMTGECVGLRVLIENMVLTDQRHLDDARRMLLCEV